MFFPKLLIKCRIYTAKLLGINAELLPNNNNKKVNKQYRANTVLIPASTRDLAKRFRG